MKNLFASVLMLLAGSLLLTQAAQAHFPEEAREIAQLEGSVDGGMALSVFGWEFEGRDGKPVFVSCARCHGANGKVSEDHHHPSLAGQNKNYLIWQMVNFKQHVRKFPVMENIANRLSHQDIADLAAYYNQLGSN